MASSGTRERRRVRIVEMLRAAPDRSSRSIAGEVGCSPHTVIRLRKLHVQVHDPERTPAAAHPGSENLQPAGPGNLRASTHGAYSEARRAPLEDLHRDRLRLAYPSAPDDLINSAAKRLAMADLFSSWIADVGLIHNRGGLPHVSDAARELRILLRDHEAAVTALGELEREASTPDPRKQLDAVIAEMAEERATNEGEK
jgi:hypothetical protein